MAVIELGEIIDAVEATISTATGIKRSQSYDELTEQIPRGDLPLIQVWATNSRCDPSTGGTERITMGGGGNPRRIKYILVNADLYAKVRGHIGEDMKESVTVIDAIMDVLEAQNTAPFFGLGVDHIKAFDWRWDWMVLDYAGVEYTGARFQLELKLF